jgi:dipeptidyl aminopeptidase/acylaminoacyl peptidase
MFATGLATIAAFAATNTVQGAGQSAPGCDDVKCIAEVLTRTATMAHLEFPNLGVSVPEQLLVFSDEGKIWTQAVGAKGNPKLLATGDTPTLSPDGERIAYWSSDKNGRQLWIADLRTRQAQRITHIKGGLIAPSYGAFDMGGIATADQIAWAPAGDHVVISMATYKSQAMVPSEPWLGASGSSAKPPITFSYKERQRDPWKKLFHPKFDGVAFWDRSGEHDQLLDIDLATGDARPIVQSDLSYIGAAWSPDGLTLAAVERNPSTLPSWKLKQQLVLIDPRSGSIRPQPIAGWLQVPSFSPDGQKLAIMHQVPDLLGFHKLAVLDMKTGAVSEVAFSGTLLDSGMRWDGNQLVFGQRNGLSDEIWSTKPTELLGAKFQGVVDDFAVAGHRVFVIAHSPDYPAAIGEVKDGRIDAYYTKPSNVKPDELADYKPMRWRSEDGSVIDGMLLLPRNRQSLPPVILNPYPSMASYSFFGGSKNLVGTGAPLFLKNGYAVFFVNARAPHTVMSFTRDEAFGRTSQGVAGLKNLVADIASGLKALRATGLVDGTRIYGYGHSNGAMTLIDLLPRYDGLKCAVIHNPALFGEESYFASPDPTMHSSWYGAPNFWDDPTFYMAFDPLAHIGTFNTPIFLIGGTEDIDFEQGMFFNGMRSAGKPITYAIYEGDDHVPSDKNLTDYWWRILAYYKKC